MERFRPIEPCQKPIVLDISDISEAKTLCDKTVAGEKMGKLEGSIKLLPNEGFKETDVIKTKDGNIDNSPTRRMRSAFHKIKDAIDTLGNAQTILVVPIKDDKGEETFEFALPEKDQIGEPQADETLTAEEKSDRIRKALNQTIRRNLSLILSAAEEIAGSSYSSLDSTDTAEDIAKIIGGVGKNGMINRFDQLQEDKI